MRILMPMYNNNILYLSFMPLLLKDGMDLPGQSPVQRIWRNVNLLSKSNIKDA
jgi:hypothetical protein